MLSARTEDRESEKITDRVLALFFSEFHCFANCCHFGSENGCILLLCIFSARTFISCSIICWSVGILVSFRMLAIGVVLYAPVIAFSPALIIACIFFMFESDVLPYMDRAYLIFDNSATMRF